MYQMKKTNMLVFVCIHTVIYLDGQFGYDTMKAKAWKSFRSFLTISHNEIEPLTPSAFFFNSSDEKLNHHKHWQERLE